MALAAEGPTSGAAGEIASPAPLDVTRDAPGAAFFDLDRTLMAGSSAFQFARASYQAGVVSRRQLAGDAWANLVFRLRGSTDQSTDALIERVASALANWRRRDIMRMAPAVLEGILPRIYPEVLAAAHAHQDAGRPVYIATAAAQEVAALLAHVLQLDGAIGTVYELRDEVYTGRLDGPFTYREGKAQAVAAFAARESVELAESWAYSDSESDLPLLRLVGHPVAVNPDAELGRVAREEGWEIMRFETIGRRLTTAGAVATLAALGGAGATIASRRRLPAGRAARVKARASSAVPRASRRT